MFKYPKNAQGCQKETGHRGPPSQTLGLQEGPGASCLEVPWSQGPKGSLQACPSPLHGPRCHPPSSPPRGLSYPCSCPKKEGRKLPRNNSSPAARLGEPELGDSPGSVGCLLPLLPHGVLIAASSQAKGVGTPHTWGRQVWDTRRPIRDRSTEAQPPCGKPCAGFSRWQPSPGAPRLQFQGR